MTVGTDSSVPEKQYVFPPGLVGDVADFIYKTSPRPVREISLAASLGFFSGVCGKAYNISGTGLNQYILLLAPTGTGKEAIASGVEKLLSMLHYAVPAAASFVGPATISSEQALIKHLSKQSSSFVSLVGEFGLALRQLSSPNANVTQIGLRKILLDLYNKSGRSGVVRPIIYSDREKNTDAVMSPAFSLLGESTPENFYSTLDEHMIAEGLLPRFTIIEYRGDRPPLNTSHSSHVPPDELLTGLSRLAAQALALMNSNRTIDVQCDVRSAQLFASFDLYCDQQINGSKDEIVRHLWNRAHIKALKAAAVVAVGRNPFEPIIDYDTALWATQFMAADAQNLIARFVSGDVGRDNSEAKQFDSVLNAISDYVTGTFDDVEGYGVASHVFDSRVVPLSFIHRKLAKLAIFRKDRVGPTQALHRAIKSLMEQGIIAELPPQQRREKFGSNGRMFMLADMWELRVNARK